ncbi:phosphatase PAP2 family protein [Cellulosimicrobium cellulans]|uniref:phosphatase PAP2 family protein n=1 Tax=Cellulosimicrobium cellulans TaxID=1710 RepID=UPI0024069E29|nr:phosphatase PAP2 family protein [Cellulosimicrobium cellulans]MDF9878045.1 membrane-associated phospholipid phosphatase [Cellulosimicrobium cellulans]
MTPPDSSRPTTLLDRPDDPAATRPTTLLDRPDDPAATRPAARPRALPDPPADASAPVAGQVLLAVSWLVGAALVVLVARLLRGPSEALYLAVTARTAELPGSGLVAEGGVLVLLGLCAVVAWRSRRAGASAVATTLVAGVGAVAAYAASEAVKSLVRQPRGCWELVEVAHCPATGDWSFPSNHTAIAFALATAVVLAGAPPVRVPGAVPARHAYRSPLREIAVWVVLPVVLAVAVATARVAEGVHFPHDVVAGAAVGVAVVVAAVTILAGPATVAVTAACRVHGVRRVLLARPA